MRLTASNNPREIIQGIRRTKLKSSIDPSMQNFQYRISYEVFGRMTRNGAQAMASPA
jgi:hypothetical protein